jgi:hypothetical protein
MLLILLDVGRLGRRRRQGPGGGRHAAARISWNLTAMAGAADR